MYASAWIFVSDPTVVSFSPSAPRPMTTPSPICPRSRTPAWSRTMTRAPIVVPAKRTAAVGTIVPAPRPSGASPRGLAVRARRLRGRLVVDRDLVLELHVVEDGHLLAADDGDLPHLVRVEPGEMHVCDATGREAEEAEDDVLHAGRQERVAVRDELA